MNTYKNYIKIYDYKIEIKKIIHKNNSNLNPIIFLHEGLGSVALWKNWPYHIAKKTNRDVILYSRIGMGNSSSLKVPRKLDYMHYEGINILPKIIKKLSIKEPIILGHSDGASIALIYSGKGFPTSALILEAPHVFVENITVKAINKSKELWLNNNLRDKLKKYHKDVDGAFNGWCDIWLSNDFKLWNIEEYLSLIKAPTLIIQGENDQYGTLKQVDRIHNCLKIKPEKFIINNCGHTPHAEYPDLVSDRIKKFLSVKY